uniref:protein archease isoform X7 n=1 Tax=Callithrix jacchus TaxID=9483 RepID=UPI0023DCF6E3|nr:protein archease isoform X7 [Callithrix jacchus]
MAQEEEDVRDYNLTEEQKAIKAKYPPVNRKYECEFGSYSRCPEVKVLSIDQRNFKLRSIGWGEEFSLSKHPQCLSPTYKWKRLTSVIQALWRPRQADHLRSGVQDQPDQHGEIPS